MKLNRSSSMQRDVDLAQCPAVATEQLKKNIKQALLLATDEDKEVVAKALIAKQQSFRATIDLLDHLRSEELPLHTQKTAEFISDLLGPAGSYERGGEDDRNDNGGCEDKEDGDELGGEKIEERDVPLQEQLLIAKRRLNETLETLESLNSQQQEKEGTTRHSDRKRKRDDGDVEDDEPGGSGNGRQNLKRGASMKKEETKQQQQQQQQQQQAIAAAQEKKTSTRKGVFGAVKAPAGDKDLAVIKPKRADRRRTIARFTTAILRAEGSHVFISRDGLGYRKAFDKFLAQTYGKTFDVNGYWWTNARVEPFVRLLIHVASEGAINISEREANELFKKKDERQAAEWVLDEAKLAKFANGMTAKELAAIFEGKSSKTKSGFPRGTPLLVPSEEILPVDIDAVAKADEAKRVAKESRTRAQSERKTSKEIIKSNSEEKKNNKNKNKKNSSLFGDARASVPTDGVKEDSQVTLNPPPAKKAKATRASSNTGSEKLSLFTDALPGRSTITPNFFPTAKQNKKNNNNIAQIAPPQMMLPPSPKTTQPQGFRLTSLTPPPDVARLFQNVQSFGGITNNNSNTNNNNAIGSSNSLLMLGRTGSRQAGATNFTAAGVARQYSSDLSRMMSEFNNDPDTSDLYLSSYQALSASELDAVAATRETNPALKRGMSRAHPTQPKFPKKKK